MNMGNLWFGQGLGQSNQLPRDLSPKFSRSNTKSTTFNITKADNGLFTCRAMISYCRFKGKGANRLGIKFGSIKVPKCPRFPCFNKKFNGAPICPI